MSIVDMVPPENGRVANKQGNSLGLRKGEHGSRRAQDQRRKDERPVLLGAVGKREERGGDDA